MADSLFKGLPMTREEAKLASQQMMDIENQMEIAQRLGYTGDIPMNKIRMLPQGARNAAMGLYTKEGFREGFDKEGLYKLDPTFDLIRQQTGDYPIDDMVYTLGIESATPRVLAHEVRHRRDDRGEKSNRLYDAAFSQNSDEWFESVKMWQNWRNTQEDKSFTISEAEEDLLSHLIDERLPSQPIVNIYASSLPEAAEGYDGGLLNRGSRALAADMAERSVAYKRYKMYKNLKEYNEQLSKENKKRKEGLLTKGGN
jgi:hypothetical protein